MEQLLTLRSCIQKLDFEAASGDASLLAQRADGENNKQPVWISRPYKLPDFLAPDGVRIPAFALYQGSFNSETCMVHYARGLAAGYRHIVTQLYNEKEGLIAHVLKSARIPRDRVFITSIIRFSKRDIPTTVATIRKAAFKLSETRPINLMLADPIQDPVSRRRLWQALEQAVEEGIVTYIGVANYNIAMLEELKTYAKIWPPRVNSLEVCSNLLPAHGSFPPSHKTLLKSQSPASSLAPTGRTSQLLQSQQHYPRHILPYRARPKVPRRHVVSTRGGKQFQTPRATSPSLRFTERMAAHHEFAHQTRGRVCAR